MRKICFACSLFVVLNGFASAQAALEGLIIDTFYIADANDAGSFDFPVPVGAVTYRLFVDMAPGWQLQALFGTTNGSTGEVDTFVIRSTTPFFNNESRGKAFSNLIPGATLDENTVLLDSWFAARRSSSNTDGVLKPDDNNGGAPAFPNLNGLLQNTDPAAGIPIQQSDGNIPSASLANWTLVGINPDQLFPFDDVNLVATEFVLSDGAFANFSNPLEGPNMHNRVLIGQFTTAGEFSGQINLQLKHSVSGEIQQWVAESPGLDQYSHPSLRWMHNDPPLVAITSPLNGVRVLSGQPLSVIAEASDADGSVVFVEFLFNGASVAIDSFAPYETSLIPVSGGVLTAIAIDDSQNTTTSSGVSIEVNPYKVRSIEQFCNLETVCMPIEVFGGGISDVIGFDLVVSFDNSKLIPTGNLFKSGDLINQTWFNAYQSVDLVNQRMVISVFLNSNAPFGTTFSGIGDILCIEFGKRPAFAAEDSTLVFITSLQASYISGGVVQLDSVSSGILSTIRNTTFFGSLAYWADNSPMVYNPDHPGDYLVTNITGSNAACDSLSMNPIHTDLNGSFTYNLNEGVYLSLDRDIAATSDVQSVINSFDAFLVRKVLKDDPTFVPSIFQLIAMDVNKDGVISAGDVSQINQRSLLIIDEFRQSWNYQSDGTPLPVYAPSKDWTFVSERTLLYDPSYTKSSSFPSDDGIGYSKYRVPQAAFCLWTEVDDQPGACPDFGIETYYGILIGDVNGNYRSNNNNGL